MSIPEQALLLYGHGMEIITDSYQLVVDMQKQYNSTSINKVVEEKIDETYWLRSRNKKRRRNIEKWIEREKTESNEDALVNELLLIVRQEIRFEYRKQYITKFVDRNVNSFEDLLQFGRFVLQHVYDNKHKWIDSPTGIENSLFCQGDWPIRQMIALNNHIYTTASTNYPCELFQEMFLYGTMPTTTAETLKKYLEKMGLQVTLKPCLGDEPYGLSAKEWVTKLCNIEIIDPILSNRDLYQNVLQFFAR